MESIISHLIIDPTWVKMTAIGSSILCGILALFTVITADNDNKKRKNQKSQNHNKIYFSLFWNNDFLNYTNHVNFPKT